MKLYIGNAKELPFVILGLSILFLLETAHQLYISQSNLQYITPVIFVFVLYNHLMVCFKEPGIIPNSNLTEEQAIASIRDIISFEGMNQEEQQDEVIAETSRTSRRTLGTPITHRNIHSQSKNLNYQYCSTCQQIKLPNAEHCDKCYACVRKHYTHSIFFANCIGQYNIKNYFLMAFGMNLLASIYVYVSGQQVIKHKNQYLNIPQQFENSSQPGNLLWILFGAIIFRFLISRRFKKIKKILSFIIVVMIVGGSIHFHITPVMNVKTAFVWVFIALAYIMFPMVLQLFFVMLILVLTGKSKKEISVTGLKSEDRSASKLFENFKNFLFGVSSENS